MLTWCSYCQRFTGETPPYENLLITHGMCRACAREGLDISDARHLQVTRLRTFYSALSAAGQAWDLAAARRIIEEARAADMRPVDVLVGIMAPLLFEIGEQWSRGEITVADEHRFTAFCEQVLGLVEQLAGPAPSREETADYLLINAPGNRHTLGIRVLALWLADRGCRVKAVDTPAEPDGLDRLIGLVKPKHLLISMALPEQRAAVATLADRVGAWPEPGRPAVLVGGYAVKLGLVSDIPGARLMTDIHQLE